MSGFPSYANAVEGTNHFAVHFSPIYMPFSPLLRATHSVVPLFVAPAIAGALVAPGVFLIARRFIPQQQAAAAAVVALLYPPLAGLVFGDPFENVFAPAATVWLLYGFEARRFWLIVVAAITGLCIKEDQALFLAATGAFLVLRYRDDPTRRTYALGLVALSIGTSAFYFGVLRPHLRPGLGDTALGWRYFYRWGTPTGPGVVPWWSASRLTYLLEVFAPLLFVPFRSAMLLLAVIPFAELLASPLAILFTNGTHYVGVRVGYVLVAYAYGLSKVRGDTVRARLIGGSVVLCALQLIFASPTHWRVHLSIPDQHDRILATALASIPSTSTICTFDEAYAHLGFDPNAMEGLRGTPEFVVIDTHHAESYFVPILERYVAMHPEYRRVETDDGIEVYRLQASPASAG